MLSSNYEFSKRESHEPTELSHVLIILLEIAEFFKNIYEFLKSKK